MVVNIIGGGPAGLMAAEQLASRHEVHLYERGKAVGRKFLVAGKGGFNLTNERNGEALAKTYLPPDLLRQALQDFDSTAVREWLQGLGIPTFVGSSGRIFPEKGIKPIEVLQAWLKRLSELGVHLHLEHEFVGFSSAGIPEIKNATTTFALQGDKTIFALGGASWPVTGSKGDWLNHFDQIQVATRPFQAANCGVEIDWPASVKAHAGKALKNCSFNYGDRHQTGEVVITDYGLEGNGIYPILPGIRRALQKGKTPQLRIDFKPQNSASQLLGKLGQKSAKKYAATLHLNTAQMAVIKAFTDKETFLSAPQFSQILKKLPLPVQGLRGLDEAISSIGGIDLAMINPNFSLKAFADIFVIGEMLDWDAPTGGYLLQACFSMGWQMGKQL